MCVCEGMEVLIKSECVCVHECVEYEECVCTRMCVCACMCEGVSTSSALSREDTAKHQWCVPESVDLNI